MISINYKLKIPANSLPIKFEKCSQRKPQIKIFIFHNLFVKPSRRLRKNLKAFVWKTKGAISLPRKPVPFKFEGQRLLLGFFTLYFMEMAECQPSLNYRASNFRLIPYIYSKFCCVCPQPRWRQKPWKGLLKVTHQAGAYPVFLSMKRQGVFLLSPAPPPRPPDGMLLHCRATPSIAFSVAICTPGWIVNTTQRPKSPVEMFFLIPIYFHPLIICSKFII